MQIRRLHDVLVGRLHDVVGTSCVCWGKYQTLVVQSATKIRQNLTKWQHFHFHGALHPPLELRLLYPITLFKSVHLLARSVVGRWHLLVSDPQMRSSDLIPHDCRWGDLPHGSLARYVKLRVVPCAENTRNVSPPPRVNDPYMYHGTCVIYVPWCMPGSLTSGFLWS